MHLKFPENATIIYRLRSTLVTYISSKPIQLHNCYYWHISATYGILQLQLAYSYYWHTTATTGILLLVLMYYCFYLYTAATTDILLEHITATHYCYIMTQTKSHFVFSIFPPSVTPKQYHKYKSFLDARNGSAKVRFSSVIGDFLLNNDFRLNTCQNFCKARSVEHIY